MNASLFQFSGECIADSEPMVLVHGPSGGAEESGPGFALREGRGGARFGDYSLWPDAWLVTAARGEVPDVAALNELAVRFGAPLWQRCMRLTGNWDRARDLAQETWFRLLRTRRSLRPDKNFRAYLTTVATNLWRDDYRAACRAGAMAANRLVALDAAGCGGDAEAGPGAHLATSGGSGAALAEAVPDTHGDEIYAQRLLIEDLNHVLACLSPLHRAVLQARFLQGESCATIGRHYGRTEQTISGWVREALAQARGHLVELDHSARGNDGSVQWEPA